MCDYRECDYQCLGFKQIPQSPELNSDTYQLYFSKPQILSAKDRIVQLFRNNFVMTLDNIGFQLHGIEPQYIYEALDRLLGTHPIKKPETFLGPFQRIGHLIYSRPYYIFQPEELINPKAPLYYKMTPLTAKIKHIDLTGLRDQPSQSCQPMSNLSSKNVIKRMKSVKN